MGTRSLTKVFDHSDRELVCLYRQHDGYPSGHGAELAEKLVGFTLVNGLRSDQTGKLANGMGCLAAQLVAEFKDGPGSFYLYAPGTTDVGEEYVYEVRATGSLAAPEAPRLVVREEYGDGKQLYDGPVSGYAAWLETWK